MSDTPRTDEEEGEGLDFIGTGTIVPASFARQLERENAALRADKELLDSNTIWLTVDGQPIWFSGCDLRKAILRAMKEAKP